MPCQARRQLLDGLQEVHVWTVSLDLGLADREACLSTLTPSERERAARFKFERDKNRFIAGRARLRGILGNCLGIEPLEVRLDYGRFGKPRLAGRDAASGFHFNMSHSESLALIAVGRGAVVGVDLERIRGGCDADEIVARFFSPREKEVYEALSERLKPEAFFNLWTRKEAWLKATGLGISRLLDQVEVSFVPGELPEVRTLPEGWGEAGSWTMHAWAPERGFAAALVTGGFKQSELTGEN